MVRVCAIRMVLATTWIHVMVWLLLCSGVFVKAACDQLRKMWSHSCNLETKQDVMTLLHTGMPCGRKHLTDYNCSCPPGKEECACVHLAYVLFMCVPPMMM